MGLGYRLPQSDALSSKKCYVESNCYNSANALLIAPTAQFLPSGDVLALWEHSLSKSREDKHCYTVLQDGEGELQPKAWRGLHCSPSARGEAQEQSGCWARDHLPANLENYQKKIRWYSFVTASRQTVTKHRLLSAVRHPTVWWYKLFRRHTQQTHALCSS